MNYKKSAAFKGLCFTVAMSIFVMDAAWAIDVRQKLLDDQQALSILSQGRMGNAPQTTPTQLQTKFETIAQSNVDTQNTILDIQDNVFSLKTANDDLIDYIGDKVQKITRPDGTVLTNIEMNSDQTIKRADLALGDGSFQVYEDGHVLQYTRPDGSVLQYNAGSLTAEVSPDGQTITTYTTDPLTQFVTAENSDIKMIFNANEVLVSLYKKAEDILVEFNDGILLSVKTPTSETIYQRSEQNGQIIVTANSSGSGTGPAVDNEGNEFVFDGLEITQIRLFNGEVISGLDWDVDGSLLRYTQRIKVDGTKIIYGYDEGIVTSIAVANSFGNPIYTYKIDAVGSKTITTESGTWNYLNDKLISYSDPTEGQIDFVYDGESVIEMHKTIDDVLHVYDTDQRLVRTEDANSIIYFNTESEYQGYATSQYTHSTGTYYQYSYSRNDRGEIVSERAEVTEQPLSTYTSTFTGQNFLDRATDPSVVVQFNFGEKIGVNPSATIQAYTYVSGDQYLYLTVSIRESGIQITKSGYNYQTNQRIYESTYLDHYIGSNKTHTARMAWEDGQVNLYLRADQGEEELVYTEVDGDWDPKLSVYSSKVPIEVIVNSQTDARETEYRASNNLIKNNLYDANFVFDNFDSTHYLTYTWNVNDSAITMGYLESIQKIELSSRHYDSTLRRQVVDFSQMIDVELFPGIEYTSRAVMTDEGLEFYIWEKGQAVPVDPLLILDQYKADSFSQAIKVSGGSLDVYQVSDIRLIDEPVYNQNAIVEDYRYNWSFENGLIQSIQTPQNGIVDIIYVDGAAAGFIKTIDGMRIEYNANGNPIRANKNNSTYEYYLTGEYAGYQKSEYDSAEDQNYEFVYELNDNNELVVHRVAKRNLAWESATSNFGSFNQLDYTTDPKIGLEVSFEQSVGNNAYVLLSAQHYTSGIASHNLYAYVYQNSIRLYSSSYDYVSRISDSNNQSFNYTFDPKAKYQVYLKWESGDANLYVQKEGGVEELIGSQTGAHWDPRLNASANNVPFRIVNTPEELKRISQRLRSSAVNDSVVLSGQLKFDSAAKDSKFFEITTAGTFNGSISNLSVQFYQSRNTFYPRMQMWDSALSKYVYKYADDIFFEILNDVEYEYEATFDNNEYQFSIWEKGQDKPEEALFTFDEFRGDSFSVNSAIRGGQFESRVYENYSEEIEAVKYDLWKDHNSWTFLRDLAPPTAALNKIEPTSAAGELPEGYPNELHYSLEGLIEDVYMDNRHYEFENGLLASVKDFDTGEVLSLELFLSDFDNITSVSLDKGNIKTHYNKDGLLESILYDGITIHYLTDSNAIEYIETANGDEIYDPVFEDGSIKSARIYDSEGNLRTYEDSHLVRLVRYDGSAYAFDTSGDLLEWLTPDGLTYKFESPYDGAILAVLQSDPNIDIPNTTVKTYEFDLDRNLKKMIKENQDIIGFTDNQQIDFINYADDNEEDQSFEYLPNGQTIVSQGDSVTIYDQNNNPVNTQITRQDNSMLNINYQYGKIRVVSQIINGEEDLLFNYTYDFDVDGTEYTLINDIKDNQTKRYHNKQLLMSEHNDTRVISTYTYDDSDRVAGVSISRLGVELHSYDYAYANDQTIVTDENNVTRFYDESRELIMLKREGATYTYSSTITRSGDLVSYIPDLAADDAQKLFDASAWNDMANLEFLESYELNDAGKLSTALTVHGQLFSFGYLDNNAVEVMQTQDGVQKFKFNLLHNTDNELTEVIRHADVSTGADDLGVDTHAWIVEASYRIGYDAERRLASIDQSSYSGDIVASVISTAYAYKKIITEELTSRELTDGSIVFYSQGHGDSGDIDRIEYPDGRMITDVLVDKSRVIQSATITDQTTGIQTLFREGQVIGQVHPDGREYYYSQGELIGFNDTELGLFAVSFVRAGGSLKETILTRDSLELHYDSSGALDYAKFLNMDDPETIMQGVEHEYEGGYAGRLGVDGDFETAHRDQRRHYSGGVGDINSTFMLEEAQTIDTLTYKMTAFGEAHGSYIKDYSAWVEVEVLVDGIWKAVPNTFAGNKRIVGRDDKLTVATGIVSMKDLNIDNVTAVRAHATGYGNSSDNSNANGGAEIYEFQFTIKDKSVFDAQYSGSALTLKGYEANLVYDENGTYTESGNQDLDFSANQINAIANELSVVPHTDYQAITLPSDFEAIYTTTAEAVLGASQMVRQEYSADGVMEVQTKADKTVTLYDNNKPTFVYDEFGTTLIEYTYDADGNIAHINLTNARNTLPKQMRATRSTIYLERRNALLKLAEQKGLAIEQIGRDSKELRIQVQSHLNYWQAQADKMANLEVRGKEARLAVANAVEQLDGAVTQLSGQIDQINQQEADSYAQLDSDVRAAADQIDNDTQIAFLELYRQKQKLETEITRQEISPVIYDTYRRLLGRDPSSSEFDFWVARTDFISGEVLYDEQLAALQSEPIPSSMKFDGNESKLKLSIDSSLEFGTNDFAVEFWANFDNQDKDQTLIDLGQDAGVQVMYRVNEDGRGQMVFNIAGDEYVTDWTPETNVFHHLAFVRDKGVVKIFINGIRVLKEPSDDNLNGLNEQVSYVFSNQDVLDEVLVSVDGIDQRYTPEGYLKREVFANGATKHYGYTYDQYGALTGVKVTKREPKTIDGIEPYFDSETGRFMRLSAYSAGFVDGYTSALYSNDQGVGAGNYNYYYQQTGERWMGRGIDIAILDSKGNLIKSDIFDTYDSDSESTRLALFLEGVAPGNYAIMAASDEVTKSLNQRAILAIESFGSSQISKLGFRESWSMIGRAGAAAGSAIEKTMAMGEGPAEVSNFETTVDYYAADGNATHAGAFFDLPKASWTSIQGYISNESFESLGTLEDGRIAGFFKNYNESLPESGFYNLTDDPNQTNSNILLHESYVNQIVQTTKDATKKIVYYDSRYSDMFVSHDRALIFANSLKKQGFEIMNADELAALMATEGKGVAIVMATGIIPNTIYDRDLPRYKKTTDKVRPFLEQGGTLVWTTNTPFFHVGDASGGYKNIGEIGVKDVLGVTPVYSRGGQIYKDQVVNHNFDSSDDVFYEDLYVGGLRFESGDMILGQAESAYTHSSTGYEPVTTNIAMPTKVIDGRQTSYGYLPKYKVNFTTGNGNEGFQIGLEGQNWGRKQTEMCVLHEDNKFNVYYKSGGEVALVASTDALANTEYNAEFELNFKTVNVYIHQANQSRPTEPVFTRSNVNWLNTGFVSSIQSGEVSIHSIEFKMHKSEYVAPSVVRKSDYIINAEDTTLDITSLKHDTGTNQTDLSNLTGELIIGGSSESNTDAFSGYLEEIRISKGNSRYQNHFAKPSVRYLPDEFTALLIRSDMHDLSLHKDYSTFGHTITNTGTVESSASVYKFEKSFLGGLTDVSQLTFPGPSSYFDGLSGYIIASGTSAIDVSKTGWSADGWVNVDELKKDQTIFSQGKDEDNYAALTITKDGRINFTYLQGGIQVVDLSSDLAIEAGAWQHIAISRHDSIMRLFINGQVVAQLTLTESLQSMGTDELQIGRLGMLQDVDKQYLGGYLDEFRFSFIPRFVSKFNPSKTEITNFWGTALVLRESYFDNDVFSDGGWYGTTLKFEGDVFPDENHTALNRPATKAINLVIAEYIDQSQELYQRTAYVDSIKDRVSAAIANITTNYLGEDDIITAEGKTIMAEAYGIKTSQIADINRFDLVQVEAYIKSRSLHFGQSAFLSLEALFDQKGIHYAREDLATHAIMVDILAGIMSPLDDGDLVLSIFALQTVAESSKITDQAMDLRSMNMSWDDLKAMFDRNRVDHNQQSFDGLIDERGSFVDSIDSFKAKVFRKETGKYIEPTQVQLDQFRQMASKLANGNIDAAIQIAADLNYEVIRYFDTDTNKTYFGLREKLQNNELTRGWGSYFISLEDGVANALVEVPHPLYDSNTPEIGSKIFTASKAKGFLMAGAHRRTNDTPGGDVTNSVDVAHLPNSIFQEVHKAWSGSEGEVTAFQVHGFRADKHDSIPNETEAVFSNGTFSNDSARLEALQTLFQDKGFKVLIEPEALAGETNEQGKHSIAIGGEFIQVELDSSIRFDDANTALAIDQIAKAIDQTSSVEASPISSNTSSKTKVVAHISGNHYVIVTDITEDTITYTDPGIGKDKENEILTITKAGFLGEWEGNVLAHQEDSLYVLNEVGVPQSYVVDNQVRQSQARELSVSETMSIRGAFWGSLLNIIATVVAIALAIPTGGLSLAGAMWTWPVVALRIGAFVASAIEGDWTTALSVVVTTALSWGFSDGGFLTSIFQGADAATASAATGVEIAKTGTESIGFFGSIFQTVQGFVTPVFNGLQGIFSWVPGVSSITLQGFTETVVRMGLNYGISAGLGALGVDPRIIGLTSNLITGAILNGVDTSSGEALVSAKDLQSISTNLYQTITITDVGNLGRDLEWGEDFTQLAALSLSTIQGSLFTADPTTTLGNAFKDIQIDLLKSFTTYGISELSESIGINSTVLSAFVLPVVGSLGRSLQANKFIIDDLNQSLVDGLVGGSLQFGLESLVDELNIDDPLLKSLSSAMITSTIKIATDSSGNIWHDVTSTVKEYATDFLTSIRTGEFVTLAANRGFDVALETYATKLFSRKSIEDIHGMGGIAQVISRRATKIEYLGQNATLIKINASDGFIYNDNNEILALIRDGKEYAGQIEVTSEGVKIINGSVVTRYSETEYSVVQIKNGQVSNVEIFSGSGERPTVRFNSIDNSAFQLDGFDITDGIVTIEGFTYTIVDSTIQNVSNDLNLPQLDYETPEHVVTEYLLLNGVREENAREGESASYFDLLRENSFYQSLEKEDISKTLVKDEPLFETGFDAISKLVLSVDTIRLTGADLAAAALKAMTNSFFDYISSNVNLLDPVTDIVKQAVTFGQNMVSKIRPVLTGIVGIYQLMQFMKDNGFVNHKLIENIRGAIIDFYTLAISTYAWPKGDLKRLEKKLVLISENQEESYLPVATSAGAQMLRLALNNLAARDVDVNIESIVMLGGAILPDINLDGSISTAINAPSVSRVINVYAENDEMRDKFSNFATLMSDLKDPVKVAERVAGNSILEKLLDPSNALEEYLDDNELIRDILKQNSLTSALLGANPTLSVYMSKIPGLETYLKDQLGDLETYIKSELGVKHLATAHTQLKKALKDYLEAYSLPQIAMQLSIKINSVMSDGIKYLLPKAKSDLIQEDIDMTSYFKNVFPDRLQGDFESFNIELVGSIGHANYVFNPDKEFKTFSKSQTSLTDNIDSQPQETLYADLFAAQLAKAAQEPDLSKLTDFLELDGIKKIGESYEVNLVDWAEALGFDIESLRSRKNV